MLSNSDRFQLEIMARFFGNNPTAMLYSTTNDDGVYLSFKTSEGDDVEIPLGYCARDISANLYTFIERSNK